MFLAKIRPHLLIALTLTAQLFGHTLPTRATTDREKSISATLGAGFEEVRIASGINSPTAMAIAPDGRIFVAEQGGKLRVIKNDALLGTPFVTVDTIATEEQGLLGVAIDPNFAVNQYVYVSYIAKTPQRHLRVSRFTAAGDVATGSEQVIFDFDNSTNAYHLAGAMAFGTDGKLYVVTGEDVGSNPQSLNSHAGKIIRLNADGSIPNDNPFFQSTSGKYRAIWARGLRNPFTIAIHPITGRIYVGDVGSDKYEEINEGVAGANYGWPNSEGPTSNPQETSPVYYYATGPAGCSVIGGDFYEPANQQFPDGYVGMFFFTDFCEGWLKYLDPANPTSPQQLGNLSGIGPVSIKTAPNGSLYYLARGSTNDIGGTGPGFETGEVYKISYTGQGTPYITSQPSDALVSVGQSAKFTVVASGEAPLSYLWQKNGANIAGATSPEYQTPPTKLSDNGAKYRVIVRNARGEVTSREAILSVTTNQSPVVTITLPMEGTRYRDGQRITYAGLAVDPETGPLPASALTWKVDLHHDSHVHPFMPPTSGQQCGHFDIPLEPHAPSGLYYRIYLSASDGMLTTTVHRDIYPLTMNTQNAPAQGDGRAPAATERRLHLPVVSGRADDC